MKTLVRQDNHVPIHGVLAPDVVCGRGYRRSVEPGDGESSYYQAVRRAGASGGE